MKVAYFSALTFPGKEAHKTYIIKACEGLAYNSEVRLFVGNQLLNEPKIFEFYDVHKRFSLKNVKTSRINFLRTIFFIAKVLKVLKKETYDFIFASEFHLFIFLALCKFLRIINQKLVFEIHLIQQNKMFRLLERWAISHASGIIVTADGLKEHYSNFLEKDKIIVCRNGIDIESFKINITSRELKKKFNLPLKKSIIGYIGSFSTMGMDKGMTHLINAFKIIKSQQKDTALCIVGGKQEEIQALKKSIKDERDIIFTGFLPPKNIPAYLKTFTIAVLPFPWTIHFAYHMSPMKIFEYMAAKKPIVASKLPSVEEILHHRKNALLTKPGDVKDLANNILLLLKNPSLASDLGRNAFKESKKYTWEKRGENIVRFLRQV